MEKWSRGVRRVVRNKKKSKVVVAFFDFLILL